MVWLEGVRTFELTTDELPKMEPLVWQQKVSRVGTESGHWAHTRRPSCVENEGVFWTDCSRVVSQACSVRLIGRGSVVPFMVLLFFIDEC